MPQMADIIVKKADGTTNITFTATNPSGGDTSQALWKSNSVSSSNFGRPELVMSSAWNGPRTARKVIGKLTYPQVYVDSSSGATISTDKVIISFDGVIPRAIEDATLSEAVEQAFNLFASALIKSCVKIGYSPT
jgi:hypothetical protein